MKIGDTLVFDTKKPNLYYMKIRVKKLKNDISKGEIKVITLKSHPEITKDLTLSQRLLTFFIQHDAFENGKDFDQVEIEFIIPQKEFSSGSLQKKDIQLYRYDPDKEEWYALTKEIIEDTNEGVHYKIRTTHLSFFVIGGKRQQDKEKEPLSNLIDEKTVEEEQPSLIDTIITEKVKKTSVNWLYYGLFGIVLVAILITGFSLYEKKQGLRKLELHDPLIKSTVIKKTTNYEEKLDKYVISSFKNSKTASEIRSSLIKIGWPEFMVTMSINKAKKEQQTKF